MLTITLEKDDGAERIFQVFDEICAQELYEELIRHENTVYVGLYELTRGSIRVHRCWHRPVEQPD